MKRAIKPIETVEELQDVQKRVVALEGSLPSTPEDEELRALIAAVEKWKIDHAGMPHTIKPRT